MPLIKTKTNYQWDKKQSTPEGEEPGVDALIRQLQLMVKDIRDDIFQLNPTLFTTLPTAEEDKRGSFVILEAAAVTDKLNICLRNAAGAFAFRQISPVTSMEDADGDTKIQVEESADEDIIRMDTSGVERWIMTAAGERTMPTQPAFLAQVAITQSNIALNADVTIIYGTEIYDQGGDFNPTTGVFTAPVTGRYVLLVNVQITELDTAVNSYVIKIVTSNRTYVQQIDGSIISAGTDGEWYLTLNVVADMDAADTALVTIRQVAGTQQSDIGASISNNFSGYLAV